jgi:adenine-specific DNA-methyltransferase
LERILNLLFQFDVAELDFGIFRILNLRRQQISQFIHENLPKVIISSFEELTSSVSDEIPTKNLTDWQRNICNHLYSFFSHYYVDGDFIPLHRFTKNSKYTIQYNGEETYFYWINRDQYYIKSNPYFRNYSFKCDNITFHFQLIEAKLDVNENKLAPKYFILKQPDGIHWDNTSHILTGNFVYRSLLEDEYKQFGGKVNQISILKDIHEEIVKFITSSIDQSILPGEFSTQMNASEHNSILFLHLKRFTGRNNRDFFIHKDLLNFLKMELDFYIKNEWVQLDDIIAAPNIQNQLLFKQIGCFKQIAEQIICLLSQIEEFQKHLWEKKKFVINTNYLLSLDKVPHEFYQEIADCTLQIQDWNSNYKIELDAADHDIILDFMETHPSLVIDTSYFSKDFNNRLLGSFSDLDGLVSGLLIKSESFQALNLMNSKYQGGVDCFYLDPPYNTGTDEFIYKDNYQRSSWLSMMANLLPYISVFGKPDSNFFISIDDHELTDLNTLLEMQFGVDSLFGPVIVQINKGGRDYLPIAKTHEYLLAGSLQPSEDTLNEIERDISGLKFTDQKGLFEIRELRNRNPKFSRLNRPNLFYPIYINPNAADSNGFCPISLKLTTDHTIETVPKNQRGVESCWRWGSPKVSEHINPMDPFESDVVARQKSDGGWNIYEKYRKETTKVKSIWDESGVRTENGTIILGQLFGSSPFDHPKPVDLIEKCLKIGSDPEDLVLDFFAGSGTTAHAVLRQNIETGKHRRYILVEMGSHFEKILIPRIKKVIFSLNWMDGKPDLEKGIQGQSQIVKYLQLEQYEDSLNNLQLKSCQVVDQLSPQNSSFLSHFLDLETNESPCFMNADSFMDPFNYRMKIIQSNGIQETPIDLVETFNFLMGIHVNQILTFIANNREYRIVRGSDDKSTILIIWRNCLYLDLLEDRNFIEQKIGSQFSAQSLYINGQFSVENAQAIEPIFKKLMEGQ